MVDITQLTPNATRQALQDDGAAALGLTAPLLSPVWSSSNPTFDAALLRLNFTTEIQFPFLGIVETLDAPIDIFEVDGTPVSGPVVRIRLHPQAAVRLITLARRRYSSGNAPLLFPVATQMVIRDTHTAGPFAPQWWEPGDPSGLAGNALSGVTTLHDRRGLIVDPIAAAAMYADIVAAFPALLTLSSNAPDQGAGVNASGGIATISGLASGVRVHVVDPHGAAFTPPVADRTLTRRIGDTVDTTLDSSGLIDLPGGQTLRASVADDNAATDPDDAIGARLLWGWSNGGRLAREPLSAPSLPNAGAPVPNLPRQFLRLTVVDLPWHLLGNRGTSPIQGIPGDDGDIPQAYQPKVRADLPIDYLSDGVEVLAAGGQVVNRLVVSPDPGMILSVSPMIDPGVATALSGDSTGRWPVFPPPNTAAGFPGPPQSPAGAMTATFTATNDVVVSIAADQVPDGAHVRLYPQQFVEIDAIGEAPSFLRGDGGAAIASSGNPLAILLRNPFHLLEGQARPSPARLTVDIVVSPRNGQRRFFANISLPVGAGPATVPADPFATPDLIATLLAAIPDFFRAICPVPLFGMSRPPAPAGTPGSVVDLFRALSSEEQPRQGPRLPTQARFETLFVTGIPDPGAGDGELSWSALVSGGRWSQETRSTLHRAGNPGNPAGPDVHAAGARVGGDLALDVARYAARRVQPIIPLPTNPGISPGWIVLMGGNNFNEPSFLSAADANGDNAGAGVMLRTVAAVCETPEFALTTFELPEESVVFQDLLASAAEELGISPPSITIGNEDRLATEIAREFYLSRHGSRDALWSLRRALGQARELVYIESPQFARTARPSGTPAAHEIDLVQVLADRMTAMPSLRVVICVPREGDFDPSYRGWVRESLQARTEAIAMLSAVDADRVTAFHPKGFPGRHALLRTTSVIVDDCWALVGTSHFRRRGMTFDGGADIVSVPYGLDNAYADRLSRFRRELMARKLGLDPLSPNDRMRSEWVRLAEPGASFKVFTDLLDQDGAGLITPIWPGPDDAAVLPATHDMADPDGSDGANFVVTFASLLAETGDG